MVEIGRRYRFDYPNEFTTLPEYSAHRGALVTVTAKGDDDEEIWDTDEDGQQKCFDRMYRIKADDGWEGSAWESELEPIEGYFVEHNGDFWQAVFPTDEAEKSSLFMTAEEAVSYMIDEGVKREAITVIPKAD